MRSSLAASPTAAAARRKRGGDEEDIDITPMIDVTFLLLIFFLVSSVPDQQTAIELPDALHGKAVSQLESIVFTIGEAGVGSAPVYAADGRVPEAQLSEDPEERAGQVRDAIGKGLRENKTSVVIKADRGVPYREVAKLISDASQTEGVRLHLAVLDNE
ncbi:ExbD/TolR family protein [Botrimarina hoheduenensis]|uniref:Colicin uptake protein TolR n=1 Tax=Botrimarina hoheduenensis TaxID=2528000 RepID=A0A5C5VWT4_9BACT|nr:biopolymer transporter ExbD [Botrimarina hoheduenensis]TWT42567.1 colicin uptake protein TolR [Botrimarina hoheduenensis]